MDTPSSASATKPKALFLSPEAPYPAIGGGALRSASLVEYLARHYSVHVIVFREAGAADPAQAFPPGLVDHVDVIELPYHSRRPWIRALRNAGRMFRNRPPLLDRFSGFGDAIEAAIARNRYQIALIEHFWCAPYVEQVRARAERVLLDLHNIESVWHATLAGSESRLRAYALRRFAEASKEEERRWLPKFDWILATSASDAKIARSMAPQAEVTVYPNTLPEIPRPTRRERVEIVFSGNLEYQPNIGAVRFFYEEIWPKLKTRRPELRWKIAGKHPEAIAGIVHGDPSVLLTGFMDDAVAELATSQVAVVPILAGSGTRVKILEAWAAATPVVSTSIGAEGLDCRPGEHLMLADDPAAFVEVVCALLDSPAERARIGEAGRKLYEERYTWPAAWKILASLLGNHPRSGSL